MGIALACCRYLRPESQPGPCASSPADDGRGDTTVGKQCRWMDNFKSRPQLSARPCSFPPVLANVASWAKMLNISCSDFWPRWRSWRPVSCFSARWPERTHFWDAFFHHNLPRLSDCTTTGRKQWLIFPQIACKSSVLHLTFSQDGAPGYRQAALQHHLISSTPYQWRKTMDGPSLRLPFGFHLGGF